MSTMTFDSRQLEIMMRVSLARSTDEARYQLCGVCIDTGSRGVRAIATDGKILAVADLGMVEGWDTVPNNPILPGAFFKALSKYWRKCKGVRSIHYAVRSAELEYDSRHINQVTLTTMETKQSFPLLEGNFPDYLQAIPRIKKPEKFHRPSGGFNVDILRKVQPILQVDDGEPCNTGRWLQGSPDDPAFAVTSGSDPILVCIMPLVADGAEGRKRMLDDDRAVMVRVCRSLLGIKAPAPEKVGA